MRINENSCVVTSDVSLVPYLKRHVLTYHSWMEDPELQELTSSAPLTLQEEYEMQQSWREDADKLTFIICLPPDGAFDTKDKRTGIDSPDRLIGDVNMFIYPSPHQDEEEMKRIEATSGPSQSDPLRLIGELELMIARKDLHRKGYGKNSLKAFLWYFMSNMADVVEEHVQSCFPAFSTSTQLTTAIAAGRKGEKGQPSPVVFDYLRVNIGHENTPSINLFKSLGFEPVSDQPNFFGEVELRWSPVMRGDNVSKSGLFGGLGWPFWNTDKGALEIKTFDASADWLTGFTTAKTPTIGEFDSSEEESR